MNRWLKSVGPWTLQAISWAGGLTVARIPIVPIEYQLQRDFLAFLIFWFSYPFMLVLVSPELGANSSQRRNARFGVAALVFGALAAGFNPRVGRPLASLGLIVCFVAVHSAAAGALASAEQRAGIPSPWSSVRAFLALALLPVFGYIVFHRRFLNLPGVARAA